MCSFVWGARVQPGVHVEVSTHPQVSVLTFQLVWEKLSLVVHCIFQPSWPKASILPPTAPVYSAPSLCGFWGFELGSSHLWGSILPTKPFPSPRLFFVSFPFSLFPLLFLFCSLPSFPVSHFPTAHVFFLTPSPKPDHQQPGLMPW